ncbi:MAG: hypothetical protein AAB425_11805, partial [Bdellovibrionota bacterium]
MKVSQGGWKGLGALVVGALVVAVAGCATTEPAKAPAAAAAHGGELSGKVVWVDMKNSALLVECQKDDECKYMKGKKGETFTFVIPDSLNGAAASWAEVSK